MNFNNERILSLYKFALQKITNERFIYRFSRSKSIFLTFDDGPNPDITPKILELLKSNKIQATFFLIGKNIEKYPEIVNNILKDGHSIGMHTMGHKNLQKMKIDEFKQDIESMEKMIFYLFNIKTPLFRAPYGKWKILWIFYFYRKLLNIHYTHVFHDHNANHEEDILKIFKNIKVKPGDILVFHDKNIYTYKALQTIVKQLKEKHLIFEKITP